MKMNNNIKNIEYKMKSSKTVLAKIRKGKIVRFLSAFIAINLLIEIASPSIAMALTAGTAAPEFASFEPVATTDMVNDFTGDFTYNLPVLSVPGPDGGGYSTSLSYHSGVSSEEEASWVGFGWTLNAGAINRQKRGYADDFKDVAIETYNKIKPNWTQTAAFSLNVEYLSKDQQKKNKDDKDNTKSKGKNDTRQGVNSTAPEPGGYDPNNLDPSPISVSASHTVRYNNYSGFSISNGFGVGVMGMANMSMNRSGGENTFGFSVNPQAVMRKIMKERSGNGKKKAWEQNERFKKLTSSFSACKGLYLKNNILKSSYSIQSFNAPPLSYSVAEHAGVAWNFSGSVQLNINIPVGFQFGVAGSFNMQANKGDENPHVYGYMYPAGSNDSDDRVNDDAKEKTLQDYQIEKETTFDKQDKYLGVPFNNADIFSATGNGVVGGFKLIHDKIGQYYPNKSISKKSIRQLGVELGIGLTFQIGFDIGVGAQKTEVGGKWKKIDYPGTINILTNFISSLSPTLQGYFNTATSGLVAGTPAYEQAVAAFLIAYNLSEAYSIFGIDKINYSSSETHPKMRFTNDPGGEMDYTSSTTRPYDELLYATIGQGKALNLEKFDLNLDKEKAQSSSYIDYTKNSTATLLQDQELINTISVTNKDGGKSEYGQAVYVKNEAELTIGFFNQDAQIHDGNYLAYHALNYTTPLSNETVVGQKIAQQYASAYLLTANTTFDYIDVDNNGPSDNDFGGWTKFDYRQVYGGTGEWYRYRAPYNGLTYNSGRVSDVHDQTGSMSSGEKEVYYMKAVETKTHVAFFITNKTAALDFPEAKYPYLYNTSHDFIASLGLNGSDSERKDGLDAAGIDANGMDLAALSESAQGTHKLEKLERIVLFSISELRTKADLAKPLSTTYFEYDYSVCSGIPNNINFNDPTKQANEKGKLTLKRVWTESGGITKSKIAPYQFNYEYFNQYPSQITAKYAWASEYNLFPTNDPNQNPMYHPEQLDMWGFYQEHGAERFSKMQPWLSQKASPSSFDPAAWQLKRIILPSGGEIHVNYEQKDYKYVQDKKAMAMVSLLPLTDQNFIYDLLHPLVGYKSDNTKFIINPDDIGDVNGDLTGYTLALQDYFVTQGNKIYFKVLYSYLDDAVPQLNAQNPRSDYVTGYTSVNDVTLDAGKIIFSLGDTHENNTNGYDGDKDKTLPRYVGYQNLLLNAGRNLGLAGSTNYENDDPLFTNIVYPDASGNSISDIKDDIKDIARQHVLGNTIDMFKDWVGGTIKNKKKQDACKVMNTELSYFRLPVYNTKKGGGIRVKRLISYDPGISGETGDAMIYGSEYIYKDDRGNSSGVATNEPPSGREENALVEILGRKRQSGFNRALNGRDSKQMEGPMGESILPGASVVHERVIIKNIHSGKTTTGFMVNKYHTCKEFPVTADNSSISKSDGTYKKTSLSLPLGLFNLDIKKAWVTQGYLFKLNDMHGKVESQATYSGNYLQSNFDETASTSKTDYHYSAPGSKIKTLVYDKGTSEMKGSMLSPGTEEDFTMFMSNVKEKTNDFSVELDLNFSYFPPCLSVGFGLSYSFSETEMCQHVTSKVVSQASYLLSTTNTTDGVTQTTENLAFDKYTGDPVLTRTYDGYVAPDEKVFTQNDKDENDALQKHNGYYYALNIPASWIYSDMGQRSNLDNLNNPTNSNQLTASVGSVVTYGGNELYDDINLPAETWINTHKLTTVVNASSTVYKKDWFDASVTSDAGVLAKLNSHYYPYRSYVYRDEVKNANDAAIKIYGGGIINQPFDFFNSWDVPVPSGQNNPPTDVLASEIGKWYSPTEIVAYSPYGYPIEERDVLGISSTAKFGYGNTMPILVAQNAKNEEVQFSDFETSNELITGITSEFAHSGQSSYDLSLDPNYVFADGYKISSDMITNNGLSIKLWLRSELNGANNLGLKNQNPQLKALIGGLSFNFKRIAETGEWALYAADIKNFNGIIAGTYDVALSYNYVTNEKVLVDDFRIQPLNTIMNCTVYTADNKVAAQFDDQHFGVYYEYNTKGQLVRKSIETERGKKTLQEQQYNTPLIYRN